MWDEFTERSDIFDPEDKYFAPNEKSFLKARSIYERMEYVSMGTSLLT